jgi:hypothetical protein
MTEAHFESIQVTAAELFGDAAGKSGAADESAGEMEFGG